jgi:CrcB protein
MNIIKAIFLVGIGGGLGSILRYLTTLLVNKYWNNSFPLATFIINSIGCFIIGILVSFASKQPWAGDNFRLLLITGFCGGYTTFSAFALENLNLVQGNYGLMAFLYIGLSVFTGIVAAWLGMYLVK